MHHVALNGPGPHDRHLDDEIVECLGPEPGQHRHLRPTLDLEHADRIGMRQHLVYGRIVLRDVGEGTVFPVVPLEEIETASDA